MPSTQSVDSITRNVRMRQHSVVREQGLVLVLVLLLVLVLVLVLLFVLLLFLPSAESL